MSDFNEEVLDLRNVSESLEGKQKELFDAICTIAWQVAADKPDLERGFEGCFTPNQADLIIRYAAGAEMVPIHAAMIKGTGMIRW